MIRLLGYKTSLVNLIIYPPHLAFSARLKTLGFTPTNDNLYHYAENNPVKYTNGETWIEKTSNTGLEYLPYRFTGKEIDEETGLYYYGARYFAPRYSRWISTDPALGEYIPSAGKDISKLPSGGIYNPFSQSLFNYSNNNPIKYVDPNGKNPVAAAIVISAIQQLKMKKL